MLSSPVKGSDFYKLTWIFVLLAMGFQNKISDVVGMVS